MPGHTAHRHPPNVKSFRFRLRPGHVLVIATTVALTTLAPSIPGLIVDDPERKGPTGWLASLVIIAVIPLVGAEPVKALALQAPGGLMVSRLRAVWCSGLVATWGLLALAGVTPTSTAATAVVLGGLMWAGPAVLCVAFSPRFAPIAGLSAFAATMLLGVQRSPTSSYDEYQTTSLVTRSWALPLRTDMPDIHPNLALLLAALLSLPIAWSTVVQHLGLPMIKSTSKGN